MTEEEFFSKISRGPGGCWTWEGRVGNDGYGRAGHKLAHRVAYELLVGPIPKGADLHHRCRHRSCVNVRGHVIPVPRALNVQFSHRERTGQMALKDLRTSKHFHNDMGERMRRAIQEAWERSQG